MYKHCVVSGGSLWHWPYEYQLNNFLIRYFFFSIKKPFTQRKRLSFFVLKKSLILSLAFECGCLKSRWTPVWKGRMLVVWEQINLECWWRNIAIFNCQIILGALKEITKETLSLNFHFQAWSLEYASRIYYLVYKRARDNFLNSG